MKCGSSDNFIFAPKQAQVKDHDTDSWDVVYRTTNQRHYQACQFQQTKKIIKKPSQPHRCAIQTDQLPENNHR